MRAEQSGRGGAWTPARTLLLVGIGLTLLGLLVWLLWTALGHYQIGRVEAISGDIATISVTESGERVTAEVVDVDLTIGAEVVVYRGDGYVSLVATSLGPVRLLKAIRGLP